MEKKKVYVMARLIAKPGVEESVKFALSQLITPTRTEKGCLSYNFYQSTHDERMFISHEVWESMEAFAAHLEAPYIIALQESGQHLLIQPLEVTFLEPLG